MGLVGSFFASCVAGAGFGLSSRYYGARFSRWFVLALWGGFGIFFVASMCMWAFGDPRSSGGTVAKYHPDREFPHWLDQAFEFIAFGLIYGSVVTFGNALGSACAFRKEGSAARMAAHLVSCGTIFLATYMLVIFPWG